MDYIVSITSQGQVTIPKKLREGLGVKNAAKAVIKRSGRKLIIEPKADFWSLPGSLGKGIRLTDEQLSNAKQVFQKQWAKK